MRFLDEIGGGSDSEKEFTHTQRNIAVGARRCPEVHWRIISKPRSWFRGVQPRADWAVDPEGVSPPGPLGWEREEAPHERPGLNRTRIEWRRSPGLTTSAC